MAFRLAHFEEHFSEQVLKKAVRLSPAVVRAKSAGLERHFLAGKHEVSFKVREGFVQQAECSCKKPLCEHLAASLLKLVNTEMSENFKGDQGPAPPDPFRNIFKRTESLPEELLRDLSKKKSSLEELLRKYLLISNYLSLNANETFSLQSKLSFLQVQLDKKFRVISTREEQKLWYQASLAMLRNNRLLQANTFYFLLLRLMTFPLRPVEVQELYHSLEKRRYKKPFEETFNAFGVIALIFEKRFSRAVGTWLHNSPEGLIYEAEMRFVKGQVNTAFRLLLKKAAIVKSADMALYLHLLQFIQLRAQRFEAWDVEERVLTELIRESYIVHPAWLGRLKEKSGKRFSKLLEPAIQNLQTNADKYFQLMRAAGRHRELLLRMLSDKSSRFSLLNELSLDLYQSFDEKMLRQYAVRLASLLQQNGYSSGEELVLNSAVMFMNRFPGQKKRLLLQMLSEMIAPLTPAGRALQAISQRASLRA